MEEEDQRGQVRSRSSPSQSRNCGAKLMVVPTTSSHGLRTYSTAVLEPETFLGDKDSEMDG